MRSSSYNIWKAIALAITLSWPATGSTQGSACLAYDNAVIGGARTSIDYIPPVPDTLLSPDSIDTALPCLLGAIKNLKPEVNSPEFGQPARGKFNRAAGAIQTIMANTENNPAALAHVVSVLRHNNSIDAVTVLTFGLRGPDYSSRLNALVILGNMIDNTTVCVPVDHLYDPLLTKSDDPLASKWRANLLGVIAVPAPWSYKENFNAISRVQRYWEKKVEQDSSLQPLSDVLENIRKRLETSSNPNRNQTLKQADLTSCLNYRPRWAPEEWMKDPPF